MNVGKKQETRNTIGENIRKVRCAAGLTLSDLGKCAKPEKIQLWEEGNSVPSTDNIIALCKILQTTPNHLLAGTYEAAVKKEPVPEEKLSIVGRNVAKLRKRKFITDTSVAEALGMTYREYYNIEQGLTSPSESNIIKLCDILQVTPNQLYGYEKFTQK